jgi:hypothetical protein
MNTDKVILSSMMVTFSSTVGASVLPTKYGGQGNLPSTRLLVGTGLTYFGLSIMGDIIPSVAGPIAAAIAVTAATYYGFPLLDNWFNEAKNPIPFIPTGETAGEQEPPL